MDELEMEIVNSHNRVAAFLFRNWRGALSVDEIDDLVQETKIAALKLRNTFRGESKFSSWLIGIARNKTLTYVQRRRQMQPLEDANNEDDEYVHPHELIVEPECDALIDAQILSERLRDEIAKLSPVHREVVDYFYYQDLSVEEVAAKIGVPKETVRTRLYYARKQLRERLRA